MLRVGVTQAPMTKPKIFLSQWHLIAGKSRVGSGVSQGSSVLLMFCSHYDGCAFRSRRPPCASQWAWAASWCWAACLPPRFISSCSSPRRTSPVTGSTLIASASAGRPPPPTLLTVWCQTRGQWALEGLPHHFFVALESKWNISTLFFLL